MAAVVALAAPQALVAQAPTNAPESTDSSGDPEAPPDGTGTEAASSTEATPPDSGAGTEAASATESAGATESTAAPEAAATEPAASEPAAATESAERAGSTPAGEPVSQDDLPPALRASALDDDFEPTPAAAPPRAPWRVVASLAVGTSLRIVRNLELQQDRFAPAFMTLRGGVALPQRGRFGHELAVAVSANLSGDGSYTSGIDPFQQWTLTPSYALRVAFPEGPVPDWVLRARVGVPMSPAPDFTWGAEVDVSITHQLLAGLGVTVELGSSTFFGAENRSGNLTVHPLVFATVGATLDWEVLR